MARTPSTPRNREYPPWKPWLDGDYLTVEWWSLLSLFESDGGPLFLLSNCILLAGEVLSTHLGKEGLTARSDCSAGDTGASDSLACLSKFMPALNLPLWSGF